MTSVSSADPLRRITGVLAVVAHPDDESFGLGAVLSELVTVEVRVSVICFTHGEASGPRGTPGDLSTVRSEELEAAAAELGLSRVELHRYPTDPSTDAGRQPHHVLRHHRAPARPVRVHSGPGALRA